MPGLKSSVFGAGFALGTHRSVQARCLLSEAHIQGHYQSGFLGLSYRGDVRNVRLELVDETKVGNTKSMLKHGIMRNAVWAFCIQVAVAGATC